MTDPYNPPPEGWQEHEGDVWIWETNEFDLQVQPADDHDGWVYMVRTAPDTTISGNVRTDEGDILDAMEIAEAVLENEFGINAQDFISEGPPADHTAHPPHTPRNDQERYDPEARTWPLASPYTTGYKHGFTDALREAVKTGNLEDYVEERRGRLKTDVIYSDGDMAFVSPDGEGGFWYDSVQEAKDQHGDIPVTQI